MSLNYETPNIVDYETGYSCASFQITTFGAVLFMPIDRHQVCRSGLLLAESMIYIGLFSGMSGNAMTK